MNTLQALKCGQITAEMIARLRAGEELILIKIELFCLYVTVNLAQTESASYRLTTYLYAAGNALDLDAIFIDSKIIQNDCDLQAEVNEYIRSIKDKFKVVVAAF